jgi:hypothetical protein
MLQILGKVGHVEALNRITRPTTQHELMKADKIKRIYCMFLFSFYVSWRSS